MDKFYSKVTCRLIDEHLAPEPEQLTDIDHICNMSDTQTAVCQILEQQKANNYVLVVTDSSDICNLVLAFNPMLKDHKVSVLCNDVLYAEDAMQELERLEKLLHTEEGTEYLPINEIEDGLFESDTGHILLNCTDEHICHDENAQLLYSSDGQPWGYVLPYTIASMIGKLHNHIENLSIAERTMLAAKVVNLFKMECLSDTIFLFKSDNGFDIQPVGIPNLYSVKELLLLIYEIYFGHKPLKDRMLSLIEDRMNHSEYPGLLFEFFEYAFADKIYPGLSCKEIRLDSLEIIINHMTWFATKEV